MSDQEYDLVSRLSKSNKRYLCSDDSDDYFSTARYRRKRLNYEDEEQGDSNECLAEELSGDREEDADEEVEEIGGGEEEIDGCGMKQDEGIISSVSPGEKEIPFDRLSALPDSVLIRILSFLNMKEAAITCVLSKRWQFLWTDLTSLNFYESSRQPEKIRDFVARVNRTLVICSGNRLVQFQVDFMYDKCYASDVNIWLEFAVKNKVKDVALRLTSCKDLYTLPLMMYSNSSFTSLSLRGCFIHPLQKIEWGSLTTLHLDELELYSSEIELILSGCPILYELVLTRCSGLNYLGLRSKTVHSLTVRDWEVRDGGRFLQIIAPHIHFLEISLNLTRKILHIRSIKSVVRAKIHFSGFDCVASSENVMRYTEEVFEKFQHVRKLELGSGCIEVLSMLTLKGWQLPLSVRGHLIVNAITDACSIPGIIGLLESSPNLETLVIHGRRGPYEISINCGPSASHLKDDLNCDLLHLKTVRITDFVDPNLAGSVLAGEPMLTLVQLLLKRAVVLEKMVLDVEEFASSSTYIQIAKMLLSYPRSSQKAAILLS